MLILTHFEKFILLLIRISDYTIRIYILWFLVTAGYMRSVRTTCDFKILNV